MLRQQQHDDALLLLLLLLLSLCGAISTQFENLEVAREVSAKGGSLVVIHASVRYAVVGSPSVGPFVYRYAVNASLALLLARDELGRLLPVEPAPPTAFLIELSAPSGLFTATEFVLDGQKPLPVPVNAEWVELATELVVSAVPFSAYPTLVCRTNVLLGGPVLDPSYHWAGGASVYDKKEHRLTFGPVERVAPHSWAPVRIVSHNPTPQVVARSLSRFCRPPWWWSSGLYCEDTWVLENAGMRQDRFNRTCPPCPGVVQRLSLVLPPDTTQIALSDRLGRVPTLAVVGATRDGVGIELLPRTMLMPGMVAQFTLSYVLSGVDKQELAFLFQEVDVVQRLYIANVTHHNVCRGRLLLPGLFPVSDNSWFEYFLRGKDADRAQQQQLTAVKFFL